MYVKHQFWKVIVWSVKCVKMNHNKQKQNKSEILLGQKMRRIRIDVWKVGQVNWVIGDANYLLSAAVKSLKQ